MKTIQSRIKKIEEALSIGKEKEILRIRVFLSCRGNEAAAEPLGPVEQWASYKQVEAQDSNATIIMFWPDPQLEIEARKRSLTPSELAGLLAQPQVA